MRHICLEVKKLHSGGDFEYREQLLSLVRATSDQQGMSVDDIRRRIRLLDIIEPMNNGDVIAIEDADHEFLVQIVKSARWATALREIVQFVDDIESGASPLPQLSVNGRQQKDLIPV